MLRAQDSIIDLRHTEPDAPGSVRGAIRALLARISGEAPAIGQTSPKADAGNRSRPLATAFENLILRRRAEARAAYDCVEGSPDAALDAALAVIEAEWLAARQERDAYAEALKAIRMYAADARTRDMAGDALTPARPKAPEARFPEPFHA